jgi:hypothetical protein
MRDSLFAPRCACVQWCGDVLEEDDKPMAVCKALPMARREPDIEIVLTHKEEE